MRLRSTAGTECEVVVLTLLVFLEGVVQRRGGGGMPGLLEKNNDS